VGALAICALCGGVPRINWKVSPRAVIEKIITARGDTFPIGGGNAFIQGVELSVLCNGDAPLGNA